MFTSKSSILSILLLLLYTVTSAQKTAENRMVVVQQKEQIVNAYVLTYKKPLRVNNNFTYSSFHHHGIHHTQGSYIGHLLHGYCEVRFSNNQLKSQGKYRYGLKHGLWKHWYKQGKLKSIASYKNGWLHGTQKQYNQQGQITQEIQYKNNQLHGLSKYYVNGALSETIRFRKGKEKTKRFNLKLFKSKKKDAGKTED